MSAEPEETNTAARNLQKLLTSVLQWRFQTFRIRGGGGHPDSEVTGGPVSKEFFWPFGHHFVQKITGGRAPPRPPPLDPPLDCYHSPSGLSRGRACYVRASAFALRADREHAHPRDNPEGLLIFHHRLLRLVTKK